MIVYSNGRYHREEEPAVTLGNGGFLHGNGVFTTLRLYRGQAIDLPDHCTRLKEHGSRLGLNLPRAREGVTEWLAEVIAELGRQNHSLQQDLRLRIPLTHQEGCSDGFLSLVTGPLPTDLDLWQTEGIPTITLGPDFQRTILPRFKTLNYLPSVLALRSAAAAGCPEAIICDANGGLLEGAVSNLFLVRQGVLMTPEDDGRILPGLTRARVLDLARNLGLETRETPLFRDDLLLADEAFLTNCVRQVVPVTSCDGRAVGPGSPGAMTSKILREYQEGLFDLNK